MAKNNAKIIPVNELIQAGIDPKTGLPIKLSSVINKTNKEDIKRAIKIVDRQDAINRFTWYACPNGLSGRLIERILYYRGQGMLFKLQDKFFFLPYALDGSIDVYGRFTGVTPLPFNGASKDENGKDKPWIQGLTFKPVYDVQVPDEFIDENGNLDESKLKSVIDNSCVLLSDISHGESQINTPRCTIQEPVIDAMSVCIPYLRTCMISSTGVKGVRVNSAPDSDSVHIASQSVDQSAQDGEMFVPIISNIEFQEITDGATAKAEEFMQSMQSLDNYRLSLYGLENGGLYQKKAHMLEAEQDMNQGSVGLVMRDSLQCRQDFCDIVNSIWGLGMWCEASEEVSQVDMNGDGLIGSDEDAINSGAHTDSTANEDEEA